MSTPRFVAFHGDANLRLNVIGRMYNDAFDGRIMQNQGYSPHGGCMIGCLLENFDRTTNAEAFEAKLNFPGWLCNVLETVFESLPPGQARHMAMTLFEGISSQAILDNLGDRLMFLLLNDVLLRHAKTRASIDNYSILKFYYHRRMLGAHVNTAEWRGIRNSIEPAHTGADAVEKWHLRTAAMLASAATNHHGIHPGHVVTELLNTAPLFGKRDLMKPEDVLSFLQVLFGTSKIISRDTVAA